MGKFALLIGVSEYASGLEPLPKAVPDVDKLKQILKHPEIGSFDKVEVLRNPDRQTMANQLYQFFRRGQKQDLLLLYFSGHGVVDGEWRFYLSSRSTQKEDGVLLPPTAIAATDIHGWMSNATCKAQKQVIILDCCNAGAFPKGMTAKATELTIDIKNQLGGNDTENQSGGKGRVILTAATSTENAFEQEGLDLSIYTHYLVEGLEKGTADLNDDGQISVEELHEYVFKKVKEAAPAMTPEIYNLARNTEPILIARSPKDDPQLKYRKEVEKRLHQGQFSIPARMLLNRRRLELGIEPDIAEAIEAEALQPWREREHNLQEYRETLEEVLRQESPLSDRTQRDLQDYQQALGLRDEDVASIQAELLVPSVSPEATDISVETEPSPLSPVIELEEKILQVDLAELFSIYKKVKSCLLEKIEEESLEDLLWTLVWDYGLIDELIEKNLELKFNKASFNELIEILQNTILRSFYFSRPDLSKVHQYFKNSLRQYVSNVVDRFVESGSYRSAEFNAELLVEISDSLSPIQWETILRAFCEDRQIYDADRCPSIFCSLFKKSIEQNEVIQPHWLSFRENLNKFSDDRHLAQKLDQLKRLIDSKIIASGEGHDNCPEATDILVEAEPSPISSIATLSSETGIDYTKLRDLLAAGNWREADQETYRVMIRAVGKKEGGWLTSEELLNFPCTDLKTIDSLWVKYSNGHFGFSVQKRIWQECGSPTDSGGKWNRFCVKVGWKNKEATAYVSYGALKFDLKNSLKGELPIAVGRWRDRPGSAYRRSLLSRNDL